MSIIKKNHWCSKIRKNPQILYYSFFFLLSIGSIYFALIKNQTLFYGDDLGFHLARIEGLAESITKGDYFPRINYFITGGMGYATGIFYPDTFLYPAALIRLLGFSLVNSYILFVVLVNFMTFIIAYHSFYCIRKSASKSFLFAFLYGLSSYRLSDVLYRAAVGEYLALMFLPLAFVGLFFIIFGDCKKWYILAVGMSCLFLAHLLTSVIFIFFIVCLMVLNFSKLIKEKERLVALLLAAGLTILFVANALFPMIEQLVFQRLRVQDTPVFYLQKMAQPLIEYIEIALQNVRFNNIGIFVLGLGLILCIRSKRLSRLNKQLLLIGLIFLFLSTSYFPHWRFHETVFNAIQFPWRYFIIVTFCMLWVFADSWDSVLFKNKRWSQVVVVSLIIGVLFSTLDVQQKLAGFTMRQTTHDTFETFDGKGELGFGSEFLPSGMTAWMKPTDLFSNPPENIQAKNLERKQNVFSFDYEVPSETKVIFPILFYKGYQAKVEGEGTVSTVHDAGIFDGGKMHGFSEVTITGRGHLTFWYEGTVIQKCSFLLSMISWLLFSLYLLFKIRVEKNKS